MIDNKLMVRVRVQEKQTTFDKILGGRCFIFAEYIGHWDSFSPYIFIKLNRRWGQAIDDNNRRIEFPPSRQVHEVVLVVESMNQ